MKNRVNDLPGITGEVINLEIKEPWMEHTDYVTRNIHNKYMFTKQTDGREAPEVIYKDEHELDSKDRDLLFGTAIHEFNKLPEDVKYRFLRAVIDAQESNYKQRLAKADATDALLALNGLYVKGDDE
jgi:hypothetical protein